MRAIKIDATTNTICEVEVSDPQQINDLISGSIETAHRFQTGDVLLVDANGGYKGLPSFKFGSYKFGYKTYCGNGVILRRGVGGWSSPTKTIKEVKRLVRFSKPNVR